MVSQTLPHSFLMLANAVSKRAPYSATCCDLCLSIAIFVVRGVAVSLQILRMRNRTSSFLIKSRVEEEINLT